MISNEHIFKRFQQYIYQNPNTIGRTFTKTYMWVCDLSIPHLKNVAIHLQFRTYIAVHKYRDVRLKKSADCV